MVLHRPVEAAGIIGMWEHESPGRPRTYFREEILSPLGAEKRDFRRLRPRVDSGTEEHQNADCDSPFAIFKPF